MRSGVVTAIAAVVDTVQGPAGSARLAALDQAASTVER